jgi:hypothetical protein
MDWITFQACLEDKLPGNPVGNREIINKFIEELTSAFQEVLAASAPKC